jgi:hypothetical protein
VTCVCFSSSQPSWARNACAAPRPHQSRVAERRLIGSLHSPVTDTMLWQAPHGNDMMTHYTVTTISKPTTLLLDTLQSPLREPDTRQRRPRTPTCTSAAAGCPAAGPPPRPRTPAASPARACCTATPPARTSGPPGTPGRAAGRTAYGLRPDGHELAGVSCAGYKSMLHEDSKAYHQPVRTQAHHQGMSSASQPGEAVLPTPSMCCTDVHGARRAAGAQRAMAPTCSSGGAARPRTSTSSEGSRSGSASSRFRPIAMATRLTATGSPAPTCARRARSAT